MDRDLKATVRRRLALIGTVVALLLGVRFASSAAIAAMDLPPEALVPIADTLEAYELALPFVLLFVFLIVAVTVGEGAKQRAGFVLVGLQASVLLLGVYNLSAGSGGVAGDLYAALAVVIVALAAGFSLLLSRDRPPLRESWGGWAYLALVMLVPAAFLLRVAAGFGLGMSAGAGGTLQGSWVVVNAPTLLLEFLAIGVWANVALDAGRSRLRARWYAFLPLALVPPFLLAFVLAPLSGYILSALITWGSNLALFAPAPLSLAIAVTAVACYVSSFILLREGDDGRERVLLLLGTATIVLAGFYPSMASVEGLSVGLLLTAVAYSSRTRPPVGDGTHVPRPEARSS